jgi:hypothetical protein
MSNITNLVNNINNNTIDKLLGNEKKVELQGDKLDKLGLGNRDLSKEFGYLGKVSQRKVVNVDNILTTRNDMIKILEKRKVDQKKGIDSDKHGIYRPAPLSYMENVPETIMQMDPYSLNRNLRTAGKYYTIRDEINYFDLNKIIKIIQTKHKYFKLNNKIYKLNDIKYQTLTKNIYMSQTLKYLLLNFLIQFNVAVKRTNVGTPYHQFTPFHIISISIIKLLYNKQINIYNYILTCELYRKNKRNSVNLYIEILYKADKDLVILNRIIGIGFRNDDQIAFNKLANRGNNNFVSIHKIDDKYRNETAIIKPDNEVNKMLKQREEQYDLNHHLKQFKCFNPRAELGIDEFSKTQNDCISFSNKFKCPGKWDIPCKNDNECPFHKANKNYDNNRGGCIKGFCEMPVNVGNAGYHFFDTKQPLCYNCKKIGKNKNCKGIKCNQCCDDQKNRYLYPKLATPDFVFKNDLTPRTVQKDTLSHHNLKPSTLASL